MSQMPTTQTQTQQSGIWSQIESQPMEKVIWGRLYAKNLTITTLDLRNEEFKAGRNPSNDLCINAEHLPLKLLNGISQIHFIISKNIADLQSPTYITDYSRNGTYVNGTLIGKGNKFILKHDDVISLSHPSYKAVVYKDEVLGQTVREFPKEIRNTYYVGKKLGNGAYGVVHLVHNAQTLQTFAMKHVQKHLLNECSKPRLNDPERVMNEVNIIKSLQHPCVIKMHDIVDTPNSVFMVLEYMKGGDLLSRIMRNKFLPDKIAKLFFLQMCYAVGYLHAKGITHRDLKPDNILLANEDEMTLVKVTDFGVSKFVHKDTIMRTLCGTFIYLAPEMFVSAEKNPYTQKVDIWSLGVVLFTMLSGTVPFSDDYGSPALDQIKKAKFAFRHSSWKSVSPDAKSLIRKILTVNPKDRPTINEILSSTWLRDPTVVQQAKRLMNINSTGVKNPIPSSSTSDIENNNDHVFTEPPRKRPRNK